MFFACLVAWFCLILIFLANLSHLFFLTVEVCCTYNIYKEGAMGCTVRVIGRPESQEVPEEVLQSLVGLEFETIGREGYLIRDGVFRLGAARLGGYVLRTRQTLNVLRVQPDRAGYRNWAMLLVRHKHFVLPAEACQVVRG